MRPYALTAVRGIDRLRTKGGAKTEWVYDLLNAQVTKENTVVPRPGTTRTAELPAGTVGLVAFGDLFHVFASEDVDLSAFPEFTLHKLLHPYDASAVVTEIHFAAPFLGVLYVVAEFDDGAVFHYWLQEASEWEAEAEYSVNQFVIATTDNGFVYRATRYGAAYQAWAPGVLRTIGNGSSIDPSRIEPTVYNEYYYEAIDTQGDNPRSGSVEPEWPTNTGQTIVENTDGFESQDQESVAPPVPPAPNTPQSGTSDPYEY